ncbi:MAG: hypothetical protein KBC88_00620 [Alphaproteobacteria bacterium]|nr:hypothetical protein [Alphaproteobacteria bacterium]MBP9867418.1 hypothetical protein [Alphaproteobacteria bacterium]
MGTKEFPVGQVHDNLDFILTSVARGDRVEVKNRTALIAIFRKATEDDKVIPVRHPQGDFVRQASPLLKSITDPFVITGIGGKILAVVEPKSSPA